MRNILTRILGSAIDWLDRGNISQDEELNREPVSEEGDAPVILTTNRANNTDSRSRNSTDQEILTFIAAWSTGEHAKSIQERLGYPDIDKVLRAVEGEHYVRGKGYVDPPVLFRPEFDALRRDAVIARLERGGPFDPAFDRIAWRLQVPVPGGWKPRRSKPGVRLNPPPKGYKRHPDPRYYRLAVNRQGKFMVWNLKEQKWTRLNPREDKHRRNLVVTVNNRTLSAAGAVLKVWRNVETKGIVFQDGDRKNLNLSNLTPKHSVKA